MLPYVPLSNPVTAAELDEKRGILVFENHISPVASFSTMKKEVASLKGKDLVQMTEIPKELTQSVTSSDLSVDNLLKLLCQEVKERKQLEKERKEVEVQRVEAENARKKAEDERKQAETAREQAEKERKQAEDERKKEEQNSQKITQELLVTIRSYKTPFNKVRVANPANTVDFNRGTPVSSARQNICRLSQFSTHSKFTSIPTR